VCELQRVPNGIATEGGDVDGVADSDFIGDVMLLIQGAL
jgi:hypothetical protein